MEGKGPGDAPEEDDPERVDVRSPVDVLAAADLLRRHAVRRPEDEPLAGQGLVALGHLHQRDRHRVAAGQLLGSDDKNSVVRMRGNELLRDFQTEEKTGAGGGNIETNGVGCADLFLDETGRGGK